MRWKVATVVLAVALLALSVLLLISERRWRELVRVGPGALFETSAHQLQECRAEAAAAQDIVRQLRYDGAVYRYDLGVERRLYTEEITDLEERLAVAQAAGQKPTMDSPDWKDVER